MNQFKFLIMILFAFLVAVFAVSNQQSVSLLFFGKEILTGISMVIVVLGSVLIGVVITAILGFIMQARLKKEIAVLNKENGSLKAKQEKLHLRIGQLEEKLQDAGVDLEKGEPKAGDDR
ncbi:MAG: LapA family protein [Elusimicrobiota bacterium]